MDQRLYMKSQTAELAGLNITAITFKHKYTNNPIHIWVILYAHLQNNIHYNYYTGSDAWNEQCANTDMHTYTSTFKLPYLWFFV